MKNGFFIVNKYSQRIEFVCRTIEFFLDHYPEIMIKLKGRIPKTDLDRISFKIKKDLFGLSGQYSLVFNADSYHQNKIILYRYLPYELSVYSGKRIIAEFPLLPDNARVFYHNNLQYESLVKIMTELEYKRIINGFIEKKY